MKESVVFIHGMFQNAKSWENWGPLFEAQGYHCIIQSWPMHEGSPANLRSDPPPGLGDLRLETVVNHYIQIIRDQVARPIVIGHSVGGLITQKLVELGLVKVGVPICSVAPNRMLTFDWGFFRNSIEIANPLIGDEPFEMDAAGFHQNFANCMTREASDAAFEATATHDSRNVLRDCMLSPGHIDLDGPRAPLLFIGAEKDEIIPSALSEKNASAYSETERLCQFHEFPNRGHFICGEPGWEEVANYTLERLTALPN